MKSSSIKKNLRLGLGISLILLLISSFASFFSIKNLIRSSDLVQHSNAVIANLEGTMSTLKDAETGQRGYLVTGQERFLSPYIGAREKALKKIDAVQRLTKDNPYLQEQSKLLKDMTEQRFVFLNNAIQLKKIKGVIEIIPLEDGKKAMDSLRILIANMEANEKSILEARTTDLSKFASYTPFLIVFAALLSLFITFFFYNKVSVDYEKRVALQQELVNTNEETANRILVIQRIASQISSGDYNIRLDANSADSLGALAGSLNSMAESLQYSFSLLADKEWLQSGIAKLNDKMVGEKTLSTLSKDALGSISDHVNAQVGLIYVLQDDNRLHLEGNFAADKNQVAKVLEIGEGLAGECFNSNKALVLKEIPDTELAISFATGKLKPTSIVALPILRNGFPVGVLELGAVHIFDEKQLEFLKSVSENIGLAIHVAQNREKLQNLLEETQTQTEELQAQTEELQAQHSELESMNAELEAQTQKIQSSEEELRVQQEELLQSNRELEERTTLLEEKNQMISDRNMEIQQKAEQLELSTKYKSEFLANMSHELRTPLNSILLLSRLMADNDKLDEEYVEYASVIQSSGQGLLTLIDEILDLSKIEAGKMLIDLENITVTEVAAGIQSLFRPLTNDKKLEFDVAIGKGISTMKTDRLRLDQILKNLLSNAIKFTSKGKVSLNIEKEQEFILFKVSDTGIGIAADKQSLIFEAFQQEDGSTRRRFGGTGLGLSISRELAKLLGGVIDVKSEEGKGSVFTLKLPVDGSSAIEFIEEPVHFIEPAPEVKALTVEVIPDEIEDDRHNITGKDKTILIIEDDTAFAKALLDFARSHKYKGLVAVRGDAGIELARKFKPRAILLDIQLPVKDGWQVMDELKSDPATRPIPVHIMSSLEAKKESLMKGAVDFINKPVALEHMKTMFQKLEDVLSKSPKKVLIVEENKQHAEALSFYLANNNISTMVADNVNTGIDALQQKEVDCVILDMGIPDRNAYETLDTIKRIEGLENLPIIVFTGKNLSKGEESKLKQYADSIVVKTAHSYQRILDEAAVFLHLVEERHADGNSKSNDQKGSSPIQQVLANKTVLIADDDVRNIFSLTKALEQHKIKVLAATDGKEALNLLKENPGVDLVLMDMMMPEMDGYESTKAIRNIPSFKKLPVIAVTAKTMVGDREKCIAAGASDYISKPVDIDQLISLLRVWLYDKG